MRLIVGLLLCGILALGGALTQPATAQVHGTEHRPEGTDPVSGLVEREVASAATLDAGFAAPAIWTDPEALYIRVILTEDLLISSGRTLTVPAHSGPATFEIDCAGHRIHVNDAGAALGTADLLRVDAGNFLPTDRYKIRRCLIHDLQTGSNEGAGNLGIRFQFPDDGEGEDLPHVLIEETEVRLENVAGTINGITACCARPGDGEAHWVLTNNRFTIAETDATNTLVRFPKWSHARLIGNVVRGGVTTGGQTVCLAQDATTSNDDGPQQIQSTGNEWIGCSHFDVAVSWNADDTFYEFSGSDSGSAIFNLGVDGVPSNYSIQPTYHIKGSYFERLGGATTLLLARSLASASIDLSYRPHQSNSECGKLFDGTVALIDAKAGTVPGPIDITLRPSFDENAGAWAVDCRFDPSELLGTSQPNLIRRATVRIGEDSYEVRNDAGTATELKVAGRRVAPTAYGLYAAPTSALCDSAVEIGDRATNTSDSPPSGWLCEAEGWRRATRLVREIRSAADLAGAWAAPPGWSAGSPLWIEAHLMNDLALTASGVITLPDLGGSDVGHFVFDGLGHKVFFANGGAVQTSMDLLRIDGEAGAESYVSIKVTNVWLIDEQEAQDGDSNTGLRFLIPDDSSPYIMVEHVKIELRSLGGTVQNVVGCCSRPGDGGTGFFSLKDIFVAVTESDLTNVDLHFEPQHFVSLSHSTMTGFPTGAGPVCMRHDAAVDARFQASTVSSNNLWQNCRRFAMEASWTANSERFARIAGEATGSDAAFILGLDAVATDAHAIPSYHISGVYEELGRFSGNPVNNATSLLQAGSSASVRLDLAYRPALFGTGSTSCGRLYTGSLINALASTTPGVIDITLTPSYEDDGSGAWSAPCRLPTTSLLGSVNQNLIRQAVVRIAEDVYQVSNPSGTATELKTAGRASAGSGTPPSADCDAAEEVGDEYTDTAAAPDNDLYRCLPSGWVKLGP
jgi:hypothetical protein